ncbi:winged helix DNA-binding protein [Desulfosediminicola ganghwensis]|uniref:winged helix DNA-binding protein n=1 Tax=Desulfosediminicola ganghwensis TaxID=2569540 RepID=UPI0010ABC708|nr:winged helix DNA-binding protein [Desulfosediminicola ganghwensis]
MTESKDQDEPTPIVSSEHLASPDSWQLSEFEYGMIISYNAFARWMMRCMSATGYVDFSPLDILVLHNVNHRKREKRLIDICFVLHVEDHHTVNYSLKKLVKAGLVGREKRGKEIFYFATEEGDAACAQYRKIREKCLTSTYRAMDQENDEMSQAAALLRLMSGIYDQASRAASSL